jgi:probable FeS assembly SUF system protein SufT
MSEQRTVVTQRDVAARLVPAGSPITIKKNTFVNIKQALGGTWTVTVGGNMARIDGTDGDAIGMQPLELNFEPAAADGSVRRNDIDKVMRTIFDPEIPVNIVDLGLVYGCEVIRRDNQNVVQVRMTLTAPTCGMGPVLISDVEYRLGLIPNVDKVEVELVFEPAWSRDMMTEEAQLELGLF